MTAGSGCLYQFVTGFTINKERTSFIYGFLEFTRLGGLQAGKFTTSRNLYSDRLHSLERVHDCRFQVFVPVCHHLRTQEAENSMDGSFLQFLSLGVLLAAKSLICRNLCCYRFRVVDGVYHDCLRLFVPVFHRFHPP